MDYIYVRGQGHRSMNFQIIFLHTDFDNFWLCVTKFMEGGGRTRHIPIDCAQSNISSLSLCLWSCAVRITQHF